MFASSSGVLSVVPGGHGARAMVLATEAGQLTNQGHQRPPEIGINLCSLFPSLSFLQTDINQAMILCKSSKRSFPIKQ